LINGANEKVHSDLTMPLVLDKYRKEIILKFFFYFNNQVHRISHEKHTDTSHNKSGQSGQSAAGDAQALSILSNKLIYS
jgi:hypothetical protein